MSNSIKEYVVIDIETSGLNAENDEILRIVAVKRTLDGNERVEELDTWIKPQKQISNRLQR
jgi:DNA polymerase III alpha subunit (gram-positive type)